MDNKSSRIWTEREAEFKFHFRRRYDEAMKCYEMGYSLVPGSDLPADIAGQYSLQARSQGLAFVVQTAAAHVDRFDLRGGGGADQRHGAPADRGQRDPTPRSA